MKQIAYISLLLAGCNLSSSPSYDEIPEESEISIAGLKSLCNGKTSVAVSRDASISGQVVANDLYGEFYHQIVIQDDSGGITIALDGENLAEKFPFGAYVSIRCNGLVLFDYGGKILLGTTPDDDGYGDIPASEIDRYISVSTQEVTLPRAVDLSFDELTDSHIDTRVRFSNVRFGSPGEPWCDSDLLTGKTISTNREILDADGNKFLVRTGWNCLYANEPLPDGSGSLIGVIDYFASELYLRVTFHEIDFPGY